MLPTNKTHNLANTAMGCFTAFLTETSYCLMNIL